jgi:hypothetical protein
MGATAVFFELVKLLIMEAIKKGAAAGVTNLITRAKISGALDLCVARVIEPLDTFFSHEGLDERRQEILALACTDELRPLLAEPARLFESSLDGQRVFDDLYTARPLPQAVRDEGMEHAYRMVFPRIAHMLCQYPPLFDLWKAEGWREDFKRLDELSEALSDIGKRVDAISARSGLTPEDLLTRVRQGLLQRVSFTVDLTGLRADKPITARPEDMFVIPVIRERKHTEAKRKQILLETSEDHLDYFLGRKRQSVIDGPPGAGKSTWSQWIQLQGMTTGPVLVVVVRLRKFAATCPPFIELLKEELGGNWAAEVDANLLRRWIDAGAVAAIFDGFDEVAPAERDVVTKWILELARYLFPCPMILTSRPLTTDHVNALPKEWKRFDLLPFDEGRIIDYITRWYKHASLIKDTERIIDAAHLASVWRADPVIRPLTDNPLMLATLLMVHHLDGQLPRGRAKLYDRYVAGMLGMRDDRYGIKAQAVELSSAQKLTILTAIAIFFQLNSIDQAGDPDMDRLLTEILSRLQCAHTPHDVLAVLRERTGLLIGPGAYNFVHKSVAEFLVAKAIVDGVAVDGRGSRLDKMRLFAERQNDRWNTVFFFWAGLVPLADLEVMVDELVDLKGEDAQALALGLSQTR